MKLSPAESVQSIVRWTPRIGRQVFFLLIMSIFPKSYCKFTVGMVLCTHVYGICDVFIELVFIRNNILNPTFHNEAVEKHPNASKSETSILINTGVFPIRIGFVQ